MSPPSVVFEHPRVAVGQIGARRHYAIPSLLHRNGFLDTLFTDMTANGALLRTLDAVLPSRLCPRPLRSLLGRKVEGVPACRIVTFPYFAMKRFLRRECDGAEGSARSRYVRHNAEFCKLVVRYGFRDANTVYLFNGAALEAFQHARTRNLHTVLEQTSSPVEIEHDILNEERARWHGWEESGLQPDDWRPMADREKEEWDLADSIVCGSPFVANGVSSLGGPAARCAVVPYGISDAFFQVQRTPRLRGPLNILFVGAIRLQKGIQYYMEAARALQGKGFTFRAVGPLRVSSKGEMELRRWVELVGPVPRSRIFEEYAWADIMVFPSLSEGSANVCYEALAAGVPVITTGNAGSIVRDGIEGYIVPIRCPESLTDRLIRLAGDRDLLATLSHNAVQRAREHTWQSYGNAILRVIESSFLAWKRSCIEPVSDHGSMCKRCVSR